MAARLQLALRDAIATALYAAAESVGAGTHHYCCSEIFPRLVHEAETGNLPEDPRDWFRQQLEFELPSTGPQAAAKRQLLERSAQLVTATRLGSANIAAMLSPAGAPKPANSVDIAQLAARCLTVAMGHQRSIEIEADWAPYKKLLREAREAQRKLRQLMPSLIAPWKLSKWSEARSRVFEYETFAEELEKIDFSDPGYSDLTGRRVWEPGAQDLADAYREIVNPNTGWSRDGPAVRFLVEALRRVYPGTNPTAAAIESLLARRGPARWIGIEQWILDELRPKGTES
jgi:hypothetical protein